MEDTIVMKPINLNHDKPTAWYGKRVLILGAARQGLALARFMVEHGAHVTLNDKQTVENLIESQHALADYPIRWVLGSHPIELLDETDLVCVSGGVPLSLPLLIEARQRGIPLTNDTQIFLEQTPATVVGITGSAGKTTTTTLVGRIAQAACSAEVKEKPFQKVWIGGNIGTPLINDLNKMTKEDLVILELSSFQLEILTRSPQIAAVLNITPNHLDRHGTMEAYIEAKAQILYHQQDRDMAILNREDLGSWGLRDRIRGELCTFGMALNDQYIGTYQDEGWVKFWDGKKAIKLLPIGEIALRGEHNRLNVLAACAIALSAGIPAWACRIGVSGFKGVPHRLEFVRSWHGADWYNDSIATAPERSMAAIRSFEEPLVLLLGGRDKNLPWHNFARLAIERARYLILFGEAADKIERTFYEIGKPELPPIVRCRNLEEAVHAAAAVAQNGDVVLLSPGATSFDEFRDFEERGECFRKWVMNL
ncbi:MAG: UDP-N-acetylmuramoyl-L-alanine--D-glutamate ligase [Anaerolineales bacterium]